MVTGDTVIRRKLPSSCSIFTAEAFAILLAVKHVFNKGNFKETFTIFTDSLSVLFTLKQLLPTHHMVQEVHEWLVLLHSRRCIQVHFCWVPAHVGVIGNERADQAGKEAMRMLYPSPISIPYSDFRSTIHFYIKDKWQASWSSLTDNLKLSIHPSIEKWQSLGITDRRTSILLTRMRIGHTHATHSYLMKSGEEGQAPLCNSCRVSLTIEHILIACPAFDLERRAASLHDRSMSEVLGNDCCIGGLMLFLRNTGFYHKF